MSWRLTPRAVLYPRLSSYAYGTTDSASIEAQEAECHAFCNARGWPVVSVVPDLDESATDHGAGLDRPGIVRMLDMIRNGRANIIVVSKDDRIARDLTDYLVLVRELKRHGATIAAADGSIDPEHPEDVRAIIGVWASADEARRIRTRTAAGLRRARDGGYATNKVPYGYRTAPSPNGRYRIIVPDPDEAPTVQLMASRLISGEPVTSLARWLNAHGYRTRPRRPRGGGEHASRTGKMWTTQAIERLLTNPAIIGRQIHKGREVLGPDGRPRVVAEPLITVDQWHALQRILSRDKGARRPVKRLLSGLLACGSCDGAMRAANHARWSEYVCRDGYARYIPDACPHPATAPAERLEDYISKQVLAILGHVEVWAETTYEVEDTRRTDAIRARDALTRELGSDDTTDDRAEEIMTQLRSLRRLIAELPTTPARERRVEPTGDTFASLWECGGVDERRALLVEVGARFTVLPGRRGRRFIPAERVIIPPTLGRITRIVRAATMQPGAIPGAPTQRGTGYVEVA